MNSSARILALLIVLSGLIVVLDQMAHIFSWYFFYWWFDIVMHFLAGFTLGVLVLYVSWRVQATYGVPIFSSSWALAIVVTMIIGLAWEIFEIEYNTPQAGYTLDTAIDLVMDLLGALLAGVVLKHSKFLGSNTFDNVKK